MRPVIPRFASTDCDFPTRTASGTRPDFTQPLRMQARGRSAAGRRLLRLKRRLITQALCRPRNWRLATALGIPVGSLESLIPSVRAGMLLVGILLSVAAILAAAVWSEVATRIGTFRPEAN